MIKIPILFIPLILYLGYDFDSASGGRTNSLGAHHYENMYSEQELPGATILAETCTFTVKCPNDTFYCFQPGFFVTYGLNPLVVTPKGDCALTTSYVVTAPTGIEVPGSGNNASGLFLPGKSVVAWTVKDSETEVSSGCATNVTVNSPIIVEVSAVMLTDATKAAPTGAAANTVYIGLEDPRYIDYRMKRLLVKASGGSPSLTYFWTAEEKGTIMSQDPKTGIAIVKPMDAGNVNYTVTVTDGKSCTATNSITIKAIDIKCVYGGKTGFVGVKVCEAKLKKDPDKCLPENQAINGVNAGRLTLGPCNAGNKEADGTLQGPNSLNSLPGLNARIYQNPTGSYFTVKIESPDISEKVMMKVLNFAGTVIEQRLVNVNQTLTLGSHYGAGIYYLLLNQGGKKLTLRLKKL